MDGDTLTEKHIRLDKEGKAEPEDAGEVYRYTVDIDKLVLVNFLIEVLLSLNNSSGKGLLDLTFSGAI